MLSGSVLFRNSPGKRNSPTTDLPKAKGALSRPTILRQDKGETAKDNFSETSRSRRLQPVGPAGNTTKPPALRGEPGADVQPPRVGTRQAAGTENRGRRWQSSTALGRTSPRSHGRPRLLPGLGDSAQLLTRGFPRFYPRSTLFSSQVFSTPTSCTAAPAGASSSYTTTNTNQGTRTPLTPSFPKLVARGSPRRSHVPQPRRSSASQPSATRRLPQGSLGSLGTAQSRPDASHHTPAPLRPRPLPPPPRQGLCSGPGRRRPQLHVGAGGCDHVRTQPARTRRDGDLVPASRRASTARERPLRSRRQPLPLTSRARRKCGLAVGADGTALPGTKSDTEESPRPAPSAEDGLHKQNHLPARGSPRCPAPPASSGLSPLPRGGSWGAARGPSGAVGCGRNAAATPRT